MKKIKTGRIFYFSFILSVLASSLLAQESVLTEITELYPEEIKFAGFVLDNEQQVTVEALALQPYRRHNGFPFSYAWILDAKTRERVWELEDAIDDDRDGMKVTYNAEFMLKPGTYEVYYSTFPHYDEQFFNGNFFGRDGRGFFSRLFGEIFDGDFDDDSRRRYYYEDEYDDLFIRVHGTGKSLDTDNVDENQTTLKNEAFLSFTALRDEEIQEQIFKVLEPVEVRIYALGEARRDGEFDFGWIVDLKKREKVWQLKFRDSDHAGGAYKNRVFNEVITLPQGTYKAVYGTDDSHSYKRWNASPPYDPAFWGMTVWINNASQKNLLTKIDSDPSTDEHAIVEFAKVRNHDYHSQGFTLKESMDLHIFALGEGDDGEMYDYGWIVDTKTREKVWIMDYYDTDPAGGASKNRLFDGVVKFDPGNYMVYYVTDGSHAYNSWNSSAPFYEKRWGLTISALDENFDPDDVTEYIESEDKSILAKLTRVGDYERKREKFTVEQDGDVHIYALGEGTSGEMHDYAWIENANTGRTVWEMTYRKTRRAGGARKNRIFDETIYLKAGEYLVFYRSDGSHSFEDWNASPPHDPINWGVTLSVVDE